MYCTPSADKVFVGLGEPYSLGSMDEADKFEKNIDDICRKFGLTYLDDSGMPRAPPVITATFPSSLLDIFKPLCRYFYPYSIFRFLV